MIKVFLLLIAFVLWIPAFGANAQTVISSAESPVIMTPVVDPDTSEGREQPQDPEPTRKTPTELDDLRPEQVYDFCKRSSDAPVYTNDLPSWRFGPWLPDGEWTVGTAILSETIRYDFGKKKAGVFEGAGIGASFRFYRDIETLGKVKKYKEDGTPVYEDGMEPKKLRLHQIHEKCRSATLKSSTKATIATPMFSITPSIFASKPVKDQEFRVEPALMLGFFQDLINVGVGFNLTGEDGDVGDVFLLFSLGAGFNFGGSD